MQVASMAASMGAFSGGGGAAKAGAGAGAGADTSAAASTDLTTPANLDQFDPNLTTIQSDQLALAESQHNQWLQDNRAAANFGGKIESGQVVVPDQFTKEAFPNGGYEMFRDLTGRTGGMGHTMTDLDAFRQVTDHGAPLEHTGMGGPNSDFAMQGEPIKVEPYQGQASDDPLVGKTVGEADFAKAMENQPKTQQRMTEINKATEGMPYDEKLKMVQEGKMPTGTQQPGKPPATKTPVKPEVKPEGPGRGGKEISSWDDLLENGLNWENIEKFLKSKEGRQWLLMDEKGFAGIGRKLSAAADGGVSGTGGLTPEERKKIYARLKKEREEKKKKERR
jgi:hypothetical protein